MKTNGNTEHAHAHANGRDEAFCRAAAQRGYTVLDGKVYHGSGGYLFELPAVPGFEHLAQPVQSFVAQACIEYASNRHGQTAKDAASAAEAVRKVMTEGLPAKDDEEGGRTKILTKLTRDEVARRVRELKPNATQATIDKTYSVHGDRIARELVALGTYEIAAKTRKEVAQTAEEEEALPIG